MPLLKNRTVLAAKQEVTEGTAIALTSGTDGIINAYEVVIDADIPTNERMTAGAFGRQAPVQGTRAGSIKFKLEGVGVGTAGTSPAWALVLLPSCGMAEDTGAWTPVSAASAQKTCTIGVYEDGKIKKLAGCMGTWTWEGDDGKIGVFSFEFKGVWVDPVDGAMFTPQFSAVVPPRFAGATITIGAFAPKLSKVSLKQGNVVELRMDAANTNNTGFIAAIITDRVSTGSMDPEDTSVATYDAFGIWKAGTTAALTCTLTGGTGAGYSFTAPALAYTSIKEGDRNKVRTNQADFQLAQDGSTVDTELALTF